MVWLLKDNEVDMNEAPCRCTAFIETEAQMQERLPFKEVTDWFWKRAKED